MKVQPWNVRAGVHISPRYPTMRNRRLAITRTDVVWEEGADEPTRTVRQAGEQGCEPDTYQMHDEGLISAVHVAADIIRREFSASPVEGAPERYEEHYEHPYRDVTEVTEVELRGFRPDEIARVRKLVG